MITDKKWEELCILSGFHKDKMEVCGEGGRKEVNYYWFSPYEINNGDYVSPNLPPKNMDSIFKWMIPKLEVQGNVVMYALINEWCHYWLEEFEDSFEALAESLYEVMKKDCDGEMSVETH